MSYDSFPEQIDSVFNELIKPMRSELEERTEVADHFFAMKKIIDLYSPRYDGQVENQVIEAEDIATREVYYIVLSEGLDGARITINSLDRGSLASIGYNFESEYDWFINTPGASTYAHTRRVSDSNAVKDMFNDILAGSHIQPVDID
jgi:hypothetical protein